MRSSVVEPHPSPGLEGRSSQYIPGPAPRSNPPTAAPERPDPAPAMQKARPRLAPAEGWFTLLLLAAAVYAVITTIIAANWVGHTFILFWSAGFGLLLGLVIAKIRQIPQAILHMAACLAGHWLSIWLASAIAFHQSWLFLLQSLRTAITSGLAATTPPGTDLVFLFYLSFLCFYLGYFGTWLTYRARLPWLVGLVYCSILLINLNYVSKVNFAKHDLSLWIFILLAALTLLIARMELAIKLVEWTNDGLHTDRTWLRKISWSFMQWTSILALLILSVSWALPTAGEPAAGVALWNRLDNAWSAVTHGNFSLNDPGSIVRAFQSPANFFSDHLTITGSISLPSGEVLYYSGTAAPQYLEGFTYDHFDGHTWLASPPGGQQSAAAGRSLPMDTAEKNVTRATTNVVIVQPPQSQKPYIFAPAEPSMFDVDTTVDTNGTTSTWMQQSPLAPGEHYKVTSNVPAAKAQDLATIPLPGQDLWPDDSNSSALMKLYLQTPGNLSSLVLSTARQWTQGATSMYAAMKMLQDHLNDPIQFTYSVTNPAVPNNVDVASWLLQTRQGYCTYYATTMTMMARLLGVPARMVNGFSYGHFDAHRKVWIVNGDDAHSWVQVYFPHHGWINFDPTPGFSLNSSAHQTKQGSSTPPSSTGQTGKHTPSKPPSTRGTRHTGDRTGQGFLAANQPQSLLLGLSLLALFGSLCFLLFALGSYWWRNLYAGANLVSGIFWRACRIASWAGLPPREWQTPFEYSRTLIQHFPQEAAPMRRLTELFVRDRWAAPHETPYAPEEDDLERLWPHLRNVLLRLILLKIGKKIPGKR
jgi:transglutaminase-like putative cysteine protease